MAEYKKICQSFSSPVSDIAGLTFGEIPETISRTFALKTFSLSDLKEKSRLRTKVLAECKLILLHKYRLSITNGTSFSLKEEVSDLEIS